MESEGPKHIPRDNVFCETDCPRCAYDHKEFMKSEEARMESEGPHTHEHSVYTRCLECQSWGINLPGETRCGNCSAEGCVLYVPDCCVRAAHAEGRKSAEKEFQELLELANSIENIYPGRYEHVERFKAWKKARGLK